MLEHVYMLCNVGYFNVELWKGQPHCGLKWSLEEQQFVALLHCLHFSPLVKKTETRPEAGKIFFLLLTLI